MAGLLHLYNGNKAEEFTQKYNIVQGTNSYVAVATSVLATFVIGAQIYTSTTTNHQARRRYTHIIEIIIQSSALYSFSILITAITALVGDNSTFTASDSVIFNADTYASAIAAFTTVYSFRTFSVKVWRSFVTISLAIRPHSYGCSYRVIKSKCKKGIDNQHDI